MTRQSVRISFRFLGLAAIAFALALPAAGVSADLPAPPQVPQPSLGAFPSIPDLPISIPLGDEENATEPDAGANDGVQSSGPEAAASAAGADQKAGTSTAGVTGVSGTVRLPGGGVSVPASSVTGPARLLVDGVSFTPSALSSRTPFVVFVRVKDSRGYLVRNAFVSINSTRRGWLQPTGMWQTKMDGTARLTMLPTKQLPLRPGKLTLVVRATTSGDGTAIAVQKIASIRVKAAH